MSGTAGGCRGGACPRPYPSALSGEGFFAEFAQRRGEILCPEGECDVARESIFALGETVSNLKLRIYLGMS